MKILLKPLIVGACLLLLCSSASADRFNVFGPYQFDKPKGKPVHYLERVAPSGDPGRYYLQVQNGTDEECEVKNISVLLNGVVIVDSGDLRLNNPVINSVELDAEASLEVVLKGQGGNYVTVEIFQEREAMIVVEEPFDGASVTSPLLRVSGKVTAYETGDLGVSVNGCPAILDGDTFCADQILLVPGWNTVTVVSSNAEGAIAETELQVFYEDGHQFAWIEMDEPVYIAPATVGMDVEKYQSTVTLSESLSCEGPAPVEVYPGERGYEAVFETPGVYTCVAQIEDQASGHLEASVSFRVMGLEELKAVAERRWDGMQNAFARGDLEGALSNISLRSQDKYRTVFTTLADRMERIAMNMQSIEFYRMYGSLALFKVKKTEVYAGQEYEITHELHFQLDSDGLWRLRQL